MRMQERKTISVVVFLTFVFGAILTIFSVITPVFSGPDDDFHLGSIWCSEGIDETKCKGVSRDEYTSYGQVPPDLFSLIACKGRNISEISDCSAETPRDTPTNVRINSGAYPSGFYRFFHNFILSDAKDSVLVMRIVNIFIFISILVFSALLLNRERVLKLFFSIILTAIPFPIFLMGTNNPQTWSLLVVIPMYFVISQILDDLENQKETRVLTKNIFLIITTVMAISSRGDGIYLLAFLFTVCALNHFQRFNKRISIFFMSWISILVIMNLNFGPKSLKLSSAKMPSENESYSLHNILELPAFLLGVLGGKGDSGYLSLGSYDLPLPSISWAFLTLSIAAISLFRFEMKSKGLTVLISLLAVVFIALYGLNQQSASTSGFFQPRYLLPFLMVAATALVDMNLNFATDRRILFIFAGLFVSFCSFAYAVILRYSTGINVEDNKYLEIFSAPNPYVAKNSIVWTELTGRTQGVIEMNSRLTFIILAILWFLLLYALFYLKRSHSLTLRVLHKKT